MRQRSVLFASVLHRLLTAVVHFDKCLRTEATCGMTQRYMPWAHTSTPHSDPKDHVKTVLKWAPESAWRRQPQTGHDDGAYRQNRVVQWAAAAKVGIADARGRLLSEFPDDTELPHSLLGAEVAAEADAAVEAALQKGSWYIHSSQSTCYSRAAFE